jgi:ATP-binding cassette, subfamily C, bacterial LapB
MEHSGSSSGRRWFDAALGRIGTIARGLNDQKSALSSGQAPPAEPLAYLLVEIARQWAGNSLQLERVGCASELFEGAEAVAAFAARLNIDVQTENRFAHQLKSNEFPAIIATKDGLGRLLLARDGNAFAARGNAGDYDISSGDIRAEEHGLVFLLQPARLDLPSEDTAKALPQSRQGNPLNDPVRDVMGHLLAKQRTQLAQVLTAAAFSNAMLLALPIYTGLIFDRVIPHSAFDTLWAISLGVFIALIADLAVRWVRLKLQDALASTASASLQATIMRRLVEMRMTDAPRSAGAMTLRLREIDSLSQLVPQFITGLVVDAPFLLLVFALIWMNGGATVFAPVLGIVLLIVVHHVASFASKAEQTRSMRLAQTQTNHLIEAVEGLETVKATRSERRVLGRYESLFDEYAYSSHISRLWIGFSNYANVTIGQMMMVLVMMIGAYKVSTGEMTIGALTTCSLLVGRVITPINQLVSSLHRLHQSRDTLAALSDAGQAQSEQTAAAEGLRPRPSDGFIRLANVNVRYPGQSRNQIEHAVLTIRPGERVGIIGRSGSGKSTMLKLMCRLIEAESGSVLVDERDLRQYDVSDLRKICGYMGQTPGLVDDTLLANLTLGVDHADPARVEHIVSVSGVADFSSHHPQGLAMMVGPRGERLSGGERQSVGLARLLLCDPKVMLLDEPTAAMDTILEMRLVKELRAQLDGKTLIIATHRAPLLDLVDRLIWLDQGRILADGPKEEVLRRLTTAA